MVMNRCMSEKRSIALYIPKCFRKGQIKIHFHKRSSKVLILPSVAAYICKGWWCKLTKIAIQKLSLEKAKVNFK